MSNTLIQALVDIGISEKEAELYIALLKTPGAQAASTLSRKMNMNRTTVYKMLLNLAKLGLVTKAIQGGVTCFYSDNPEDRLKMLIDNRQNLLQKVNQRILDSLPFLTIDPFSQEKNLPKVRYYEGIEGIKQIYEEILKVGEDYYRYGDITKIYGALGDFTDDFIRRRNKLKITANAIMPFYKRDEKEIEEKDKMELRKVLYIPNELFPIEGEVRIFGNKVAIMSLRKESLIGVVIESEAVANMFKSIFMLTWKDYAKQAFKLD